MESSTAPEPPLTLLQRREIEVQIVGPLIRGFEAEFGRERTLEVVVGSSPTWPARVVRIWPERSARPRADRLRHLFGLLDSRALDIDALEQDESASPSSRTPPPAMPRCTAPGLGRPLSAPAFLHLAIRPSSRVSTPTSS